MESTPRILFLIPAHNEEDLIAACVRSVCSLSYPRETVGVVVIADNCSDATVLHAEGAGAEVWERHDQLRLGKSEAIRWAIGRSNLSAWDAVVILDADSAVEAEFARALAEFAPIRHRIIQTYFGTSNEFATWLTRLSGVLTRIRYEVEYPKRQARGLNVPLTGNGMCIGAAILETEGWQATSITENWELFARWTASGVRIHYAQDAVLRSQESSSLRQSASQRLRWAAGRAEVFRTWRGRILRSEAISVRQKLDALWILGAPSPIVGALLSVGGLVLCLMLLPYPMSVVAAAAFGLTLFPMGLATARVLWHHPQPLPTVFSCALLPLYAVWRATMQVKAILLGTSAGWVRTARK